MKKCFMGTTPEESFKLEFGDKYKECCGEIYKTNKNLLVINCVLCDEKFGSFQTFCQHLSDDHNEHDLVEANEWNSLNISFSPQDKESAEQATADDYYEDKYEIKDEELFTEASSNDDSQNLTTTVLLEAEITPMLFTEPTADNAEDSSRKIERKLRTKERYLQRLETSNTKKGSENNSAERKFICDICNSGFTDKSNMLAHKRRHSGQKKYECIHCPKRFYTNSELKTHMCFHTRERPFICSTCGKGFLTSGAMTGHMRRHTNERLYKCEHCDKRFFEGKHLKDHSVTHTQERKHICEICSSAFLLHKTLKQHLKIHANKREYVCHICNAAYNQSPALSLHMKKHGEKLHQTSFEEKI